MDTKVKRNNTIKYLNGSGHNGAEKTRFTHEFRQEAIKLVLEHRYTQVEAAKRLGISSKNLSRWIKEQTAGKKSPVTEKHWVLAHLLIN